MKRVSQMHHIRFSLSAACAVGMGLCNFSLHAAPAPPPLQQQAVVQTGTGGPEVLKLESVPVPVPGSEQVLIRIYAASVNPADWGQLEHAAPVDGTVRRVPGLDVSGVIAAVGPGVTDRSVGMAVFGMVDHAATGLNGGYEQYALANAHSTALKPDNLSFAQAAGLGVAGVTALRALDNGGAQAGQRVLITGVAGGVGSTAAQIAVARGAIVLGTASPRHEAFVRGLGIAKFIDYTQGDVAGQAGRSDVVIDTVGGSEAIDAFHTLQPGGRFVSVARAGITAEQCAAAQVQCFGSPGPAAAAPVAALLQVAQLAGAGKITVHVDQTYPLASAAEALQYVHQGHTEGKVILAVTPQAQQR
jgi:NADPH:quinone reductase-like Zn-dependent oxidoreductase